MGRYLARRAEQPADLDRVIALRSQIFRPGSAPDADRDRFDDRCVHMLIDDASGSLAGSFRLMIMPAEAAGESYSAQFYDLAALASRGGRISELGRFCLAPDVTDPEVLRVALAAMTQIVDDEGVGFLVGCSSFAGVDPGPYGHAFSLLGRQFVAPPDWRPARKADRVHRFELHDPGAHPGQGFSEMPPLLRSYLAIGGKVSDHAVIDDELNTMHVFTGVEVDKIPAARKRRLRAMAAAD